MSFTENAAVLSRTATTGGEPRPEAPDTPTSIAQSEEVLRNTLPVIIQHGRGFAPMSYAVWYEYVRNENAELRAAIDDAIMGAGRISDIETLDLYQRYVADKLEAAVLDSRLSLSHLLQNISGTIDSTRDSTSRFRKLLERLTDASSATVSVDHIITTINSLRDATHDVTSVFADLREQIRESNSEARRIAIELAATKKQALIDPLTGLLNRRAFDDAMTVFRDQAVAATGKGGLLSLLIIDIDHFKIVNDTYGHPFGDHVIRTIAGAIAAKLRGDDSVYRIGGEEFAILLPRTNSDNAMVIAERIRNAVESTAIPLTSSEVDSSWWRRALRRVKCAIAKYRPSGQHNFRTTISAGVAHYQSTEATVDLLQRADQALYRAKENGRNRVCGSQSN